MKSSNFDEASSSPHETSNPDVATVFLTPSGKNTKT